ncbi:uncharacterized protein BP5553_02200 [Venustampulla echinocandica]|uniref:C2H2-type domain-containing protein n=1 Tax=Venustampulla echinocandica TaxID=2656787 RepID=A0A370U360_9HELO|nr:uncharacterized protein BP5553_02200 [Venustampulla echinocandica]RDL42221.1 hypothetical protein BP5553_02200 [Venustampulla echinocandica]
MASSPQARSPVITVISSPVASQAKICLELFDLVAEFPSIGSEAADCFGRFKLWAGNLGALHGLEIESSLDFRLRNTPKIATQIIDLLEELTESLEEAYSIASNTRANRTSSLIDDADVSRPDGDEEVSEIKEIFASITDAINNLFRLSMIIRNSTSRDRYSKAAAAAAASSPFNDQFDISHVRHKFPTLHSKGKDWLAIRLGKAITQRRQYLWYCREHHARTLRDPQSVTSKDRTTLRPSFAAGMGADGQSAHLNTALSGIGQTQASTLLLTSDLIPHEDPAEELRSETSYATSIDEDKSSTKLTVIPLDNVSKDLSHFECPYCWQIQGTKTQKAWRKHVLSDLKPYVCTFEACELKMFADPHTWFLHELQDHRKEWKCYFCSHSSFTSSGDYKSHLKHRHSSSFFEDQIPVLLGMSQRPAITASPADCPFCDDWETRLRKINLHIPASETLVVTSNQFKHHVGAHMEQLALFAIPRGYTEEGSADSNIAEARVDSEKSSLIDNVHQWDVEEPGKSRESSATEADIPRLPTLQDVLSNSAPDPWILGAFEECISRNNGLELSEFLEDARRYLKVYHNMTNEEPIYELVSQYASDQTYIRMMWKSLLDTYIVANAPKVVDIPSSIRDHLISLHYASMPPDPADLDLIISVICVLLDDFPIDSYANFIKSERAYGLDRSAGLEYATNERKSERLDSENNLISDVDTIHGPTIDEVSPEEERNSYHVYTIKAAPLNEGEDPNWSTAAFVKEQLAESEIIEQTKRLNDLNRQPVAEKRASLMCNQQDPISDFCLASNELETTFEWSLIQLDSEERFIMPEMKKTSMLTAYIIRSRMGALGDMTSASWNICAYCDKFQGNSQKDQLRRHIRNYHHVEDSASFQDGDQISELLYYCHHDSCDLAGKNGWMSEIDMVKHVKKVHGFSNFGLNGFRLDATRPLAAPSHTT